MSAPSLSSAVDALRGRKILVLGGCGAIGSRLAEVLAGEVRAGVTVLARTLSKASRVARHPVRLVRGDVLDAALLDQVMAGQELVVDMTYPAAAPLRERCRAARRMAATIAGAALKQKVPRLVHLSSVSAYGPLTAPVVDESTPRRPGGDSYGAAKLAGEAEMIRQAEKSGLPVAILQPAVVYGPFTGWTTGPLAQLRRGRVVLPDHGRGVCNAVYVDDVVQAILRAAVAPGIEGEAFLVSGDPPVTWGGFFAAYEAMLGFSATAPMDLSAVRAVLGRERRNARPVRHLIRLLRANGEFRQAVLRLPVIAQVYGAARLLLSRRRMEGVKDRLMDRVNGPPAAPERPLVYPVPAALELMASGSRVSIARARERLGYAPAYDLARGMAATREWAEWARLPGPET